MTTYLSQLLLPVPNIAPAGALLSPAFHRRIRSFARLISLRFSLAASAVALAAFVQSADALVATSQASSADMPEQRLSLVVSREEAVVISVRTIGPADSERARGGRGQESGPPDPFAERSGTGDVQGTPDRSLASGVIIDSKGYALTNAHAVVGAVHLRIRLASGREATARVLGYDLPTDIALLRLDTSGLAAARLGDPAELSVGDGVFAIGAPFGLELSVTSGIVSAKPRYMPGGGGVPMIQTDVAINPGSSGSPLFNLRGELIGINSMMMSSSGGYDGVSLALPIDVAMHVASELRDHGYVRRSRLGARVQEVTPELARSFGVAEQGGAVILSVSRGGPADRAGLRTGDIILGLRGASERSYPILQQAIAAAIHHETLEIEVWRRGAIIQLALQPETMEREPEADASPPAAPVSEPRFGLVVEELNAAQRSARGLQGGGIAVRATKGPSREAGVQAGDVILAVNDVTIANVAAFDAALARIVGGRPTALLVQRGGVLGYLVVQPD